MWVRTQLKIGWNDLWLGALRAVFPPQREAQLQKAESFFFGDGKWMAAFSVRTRFELLLRSLDLTAGDEVIFSAVNVKGMVKIVTELGLVPVPSETHRFSSRHQDCLFPTDVGECVPLLQEAGSQLRR
jgi:perosamine synthetase